MPTPPPLPRDANPSWMGHVQPQDYRPAPGHFGPAVQPAAPLGGPPGWWGVPGPAATRRRGGLVWLTFAVTLLAFASLFLVVPPLLASTGPAGFLGGFVASLFPLAVVLLTVRVIDRWEPEPKRLLYFAFTWGAAVSIAATMLLQPLFLVGAEFPSEAALRTYLVTVQAPIVEESAKGLGLLVLLLAARRHFDGPVDGVVFAFTIAAGFAFTENILYFGRAIADPVVSGDLAQVFVLRGIMSPFAHAVFTGTTGLVMGFAARRGRAWTAVMAFAVGVLPAMFLHNRWNSMGENFLAEYVLVQVPLFLAAVAGIVVLRIAENRLTRQRLLEYAAAGWFTVDEVEMLATTAGRRAALRWAGGLGRKRQMKEFVAAVTRLANIRQRILSGRDVPLHQAEERLQLQRVLALRAAVAG
ncbi:PrsW family intramembrane metalloprotease [Pseudarthrobacter sp. NPDC058362]|uniref:PrsW family intramembrane metalloprotease n=1 Tax=Pseudarthrobacter sp. NPDC058362 TaxID=3346458 RepID=UPI0036674477